ncbi:hypothetical protein B5X24_HaOG205631 [Helicoverpa armigera]|uniref:Uncharacterized protein n=1 Tax=Helicoverpa armigera TaxID=29058 RepID=A0A2W1BNG2_HELAM|nr:hypothetical protein B5X24_HaOG205631 [Helicoverpa armigera]
MMKYTCVALFFCCVLFCAGYHLDSRCSDKNEVYTHYKKDCPPDTCISLVAKIKCNDSEPYKKGCVCNSGYLRQDKNSPCIPFCMCEEMIHSEYCVSYEH